jgi:hypothetical protein
MLYVVSLLNKLKLFKFKIIEIFVCACARVEIKYFIEKINLTL